MSFKTTKSWVVQIQFQSKKPVWMGNVYAETRQEATRQARLMVNSIFDDSVMIIRIAMGSMKINFDEVVPSFEVA